MAFMGSDTSLTVIRRCCYLLASSSSDEYAGLTMVVECCAQGRIPAKNNWADEVTGDEATSTA
jgi:hypothetical protein